MHISEDPKEWAKEIIQFAGRDKAELLMNSLKNELSIKIHNDEMQKMNELKEKIRQQERNDKL